MMLKVYKIKAAILYEKQVAEEKFDKKIIHISL